jgi:hypothetical protein
MIDCPGVVVESSIPITGSFYAYTRTGGSGNANIQTGLSASNNIQTSPYASNLSDCSEVSNSSYPAPISDPYAVCNKIGEWVSKNNMTCQLKS